jgi:predicted DNA-binding protein with PD1-like motif
MFHRIAFHHAAKPSDSQVRAVRVKGGLKVLLRPGDDVLSELHKAMIKEGIRRAKVYGIGGVGDVKYNDADGQPHVEKGAGDPNSLEMTSLRGPISIGRKGKLKHNLQVSFAGDNFKVNQGPLSGAGVSYIAEIEMVTKRRFSRLRDAFESAATNQERNPGVHKIKGALVLDLAPGADIVEAIKALMVSRKIPSATTMIVGEVEKATFGYYNSDLKDYAPHDVSAGSIVSMTGTVAREPGSNGSLSGPLSPHTHGSVRLPTDEVIGGHLMSATAGKGARVLVVPEKKAFYRVKDPEVYGLKVVQLSDTNDTSKLKRVTNSLRKALKCG